MRHASQPNFPTYLELTSLLGQLLSFIKHDVPLNKVQEHRKLYDVVKAEVQAPGKFTVLQIRDIARILEHQDSWKEWLTTDKDPYVLAGILERMARAADVTIDTPAPLVKIVEAWTGHTLRGPRFQEELLETLFGRVWLDLSALHDHVGHTGCADKIWQLRPAFAPNVKFIAHPPSMDLPPL